MQRKKTLCSFKHGRISILAAFMSLCMTVAFAQTSTVKGKVLDELGEAVIGANVVEKGTPNGTITDLDGNYSLTIANPQRAVLQFSFIGYNTTEEQVQGRTTIDLTLQPSVINLGEVVAIGYGTQTRRQITGSVSNVTAEDFNKGVSRNASDLLQGKVAGLVITSGSGDVTRDSQIRLRGTSTLQNEKGPYIVIDGVPGGEMSSVAPDDIESISVLKDASSAAIYGSRSAGGVILITTKRGSGSKTAVSYNGYVAVDVLANKPDLMTADDWRAYASYAGRDGSVYDAYNADTDWFGEVTRTGFSQNHNVSMSGGSSKSNYRASFNYMGREGVMRDNSSDRYNFRFQFSQRAINDRLKLSLTGVASMMDNQEAWRDVYIRAYSMLPVYPVYNADGSYFDKVNREFDQGNPVQAQDLNSNMIDYNNYYGHGEISFDILHNLTAKASLYKGRNMRKRTEYTDSRTYGGFNDNGSGRIQNWEDDRTLMEWTLDYNTTFGDNHKLTALGGYSWEENEESWVSARNRNFINNDLQADNLQSGQGLRTGDVESSRKMYRMISLFARANYSYQERYMVTATVRRDGSSKFGENNKWGVFPSVSAAWGISQESFMQDVSWVNDLKLRAGYGLTGNQDGLDPYKTLELYGSDGTYYDNGAWKTAYKINQNPNPDLKWETTAMLNVGVDFEIFNGKVGGTIEFYDKKTTDMLYNYTVPTPPYVHSTMQANVGDMSNKGVELLLNVNWIRNREFSWTTSFNASHNKNEITKLSNDLYSTKRVYTGDPWIRGGSGTNSHVVEEGRPVGQFFMLECTGLDADGKYIITDVNGDGKISEDDRTYVGDAQPDLTYGINNTFNYKNWDFSFFLRGTVGNKVLNGPRMAYATSAYLLGTNALNDPLVYDLKENPRICSYYLENGSFMRLDNLSLGYTFDTKKVNWLDNARVYVTAQNLFVITAYKGLDPEVELARPGQGSSDAGLSPGIEQREFLPKSKTFTVGVSLNF